VTMAFKRLPMRESVIRQTTILSAQLGAVNLSQGFPDDDTFPELKEFAIRAIHGPNHQYTNPWGSPVLREAVARKLASFNKIQADPEKNIVITCGATEGMIVAMESLIERGSEVITFAPMYENYVLQAIASGLDLKMLELWDPDFSFTREDLERLYNPRTRAVLLCNPVNPTGKVFTREELQTVIDFARAHDLLIFSDETYEYLIWPGHEHVSTASLPGGADITVTCTSMGKTYSVTGWRVGYLVAEESLTNELRKMHDFHTVTAPHPFQIALATAINELPQSFYDALRAEYWTRKKILCDALAATGITWYEPGGSYFLWCQYSDLSDEDDTQFATRLLHEAGVAGVAGSVFYPTTMKNPKRLRFTYSKSRATMEAAAARLAKFAARTAVS